MSTGCFIVSFTSWFKCQLQLCLFCICFSWILNIVLPLHRLKISYRKKTRQNYFKDEVSNKLKAPLNINFMSIVSKYSHLLHLYLFKIDVAPTEELQSVGRRHWLRRQWIVSDSFDKAAPSGHCDCSCVPTSDWSLYQIRLRLKLKMEMELKWPVMSLNLWGRFNFKLIYNKKNCSNMCAQDLKNLIRVAEGLSQCHTCGLDIWIRKISIYKILKRKKEIQSLCVGSFCCCDV